MGLLSAMALCGFDLVEALECTVMTFVETPVALHWQPHLPQSVEGEVISDYGSGQHRGVSHIEAETLSSHGVAGRNGLSDALIGEWHIVPTGEQVAKVPRGLTVAQHDEGANHGCHRRGYAATDHKDCDNELPGGDYRVVITG
jgi:hypothetical protein